MRFEVTRALDAIERRLSTDPLKTGAVVDLGEAVRFADLDGGRPAQLIRVGMVIDALSRQLGDDGVALYPVASRALLSDTDLTSNERMVIRRWSDDGLAEVVPAELPALARVCEVAALIGQPVLTRLPLPGYSGVRYAPVPSPGGAALDGGLGTTPQRHAVLGRRWQCSVPDCASFGVTAGPFSGGAARDGGQPPPHLVRGVPFCPRHGERLADAGTQPAAVPMVARVDGAVRERFVVTEGRPVVVGRSPDGRDGIVLGPHLDDEAVRRVSRNHLRLEVRGGELSVTDLSTNGTVVLSRPGPRDAPRPVGLSLDKPYVLGEWDLVQLHEGVEVCRADRQSASGGVAQQSSVMGDAPTMAMRLPRP
ncbi:FHA domain-containing protein [Planosporangium sp. 12N6]|uniref:FHA domain-containing protein n=1 Tax=Planosporangium spinosum TaxID=3402278 RepID=UPI003CED8BF6